MNLLSLFKDYLSSQNKPSSKSTIKNYASDLKFFIKWAEQNYSFNFDPKLINADIIENFKRSNVDRISASSLDRHISSIRKFFLFLKEQNYIGSFPFEKSTPENKNEDLWHINKFKNHLYSGGSSGITIKNYLIDIRQFLDWVQRVTNVKDAWNVKDQNIFNKINPEIIEEYKKRLLSEGFSPLTINRKLSSIRNFVRWAMKEKIIENYENLKSTSNKQAASPRGFFIYPFKEKKTLQAEILKEENKDIRYSIFPPLRLVQKSIGLTNSSIDFLVKNLGSTFSQLEYALWIINKKPIFIDNVLKIPTVLNPVLGIPNIKKSFYAPFAVSTKYFSLSKRMAYQILHNRPKWYLKYRNNPIVHYLHFSFLIIFMSMLGFGAYQKFFQDSHVKKGVLGDLTFAAPRVLTFKDKLTDSFGRPITNETLVRFSIYNDPQASGSSLLWQDVDNIKPNENGEFSATLGNKVQIPQNIFLAYPSLWLGITVAQTEELFPRKQISNVSLSSNSQKLRGLDPITTGGYSNVILALDSSGNLSIGGETTHIFQTLDSQFVISGNVLTLATVLGTNTNIELNPDGLGKIDLQKPLHNSSNNNNIQTAAGSVEIDDLLSILATSSGQSALTINQNDIGPLISASSSGIAKFTVDNFGNTTIDGDVILSGINPIISANSQNSNLSLTTNGKGVFTIQSVSSGDIRFFSALNTLSSGGDLKISGNLNLSSPSAITTFSGVKYTWPNSGGNNGYFLQTNGSGILSWAQLPTITNWWNQTGGNVGLGTANPNFRLDIQDSQAATAAANIENTAPNQTAGHTGLIIKMGAAGSETDTNSNDAFIKFLRGDGKRKGQIIGSSAGIVYETGQADFAEYYPKSDASEPLELGDVICLSKNTGVTKCNKDNDAMLGVLSNTYGFIGNGEHAEDQNYIPVGIVGQLPAKVASDSVTISPSDPLTISLTEPGKVTKATKSGFIIGRALESFDSSDCTTSYSSENFGLVDSNKICTGKILILLNIGYYDPSSSLVYAFEKAKDDVLSGINNINSLLVDNLSAGIIKAKNITVDSLNVASDEVLIGGKNLKEYLAAAIEDALTKNQTNIISPIASIEEIHTNVISPLAQGNLTVKLSPNKESSFVVQNSSGSSIATIDSSGNATFSGALSSADASVSGTLRARKIIADEIEGNSPTPEYIDISTLSSQFVYIDNLSATTASFAQGLIALGPSSVTDMSVAGQLSIGTNLILADGSINVLGHDLEIQPLKQGGISFLSGLIYIDIDGNLKVGGNAEFAKNVTVLGKLASNIIAPIPNQDLIFDLTDESGNSNLVIKNSTGSSVLSINQLGDLISSGSGTFNKLNLVVAKPALAISQTEITATGSAGIATISAYQKELTINNVLVTEKSLIYITPRVNTDNIVLFLLRQTPDLSFTIGVNTPLNKGVPFNWFIIN